MRDLLEHPDFGGTHVLAERHHFVPGTRILIVQLAYVRPEQSLGTHGYEIEVVEITECGLVCYRYIGGAGSSELPRVPLKNLLRTTGGSACLVPLKGECSVGESAHVLPFPKAA